MNANYKNEYRCITAMAASLLVTVLLGYGAVGAALVEKKLDNQNITDAIENELLFDRAVPANDIDVKVVDGVVTLRGKVGNILAKERAARMAETVKGVRSVVNLVKVKPATTRSDSAIERDVQRALLEDPATDSYEVRVSVKNSVVKLTGTTQSRTEKQLCGTVAKGVKGVIDVENKIRIKYKSERPDVEIRPEIEKALRWSVLVDDALIDVEVDDGEVTLTGTVGSAAEKRQAIVQAWVVGVKSVDASDLKVARWARNEDLRKDKYVAKSAVEIRDAIKDAFLYDPRVSSFNVTPDIAGSTVTLRGTVDNLKAKRAAEQDARHTVGVTYVSNRLKVRPDDDLTDFEVAGNIRAALNRDAYVDRYDITVSVVGGIAYLSGTVDSYFEKWRADDAASKVRGVVMVRNNLEVDYGGPIVYDPYVDDDYPYVDDWYDYEPNHSFTSDIEIKQDIESELWWSPFVDEDEVKVEVSGGVATLTGSVDSWIEHGAATDNAYEGGATWVDNSDLEVK